MRTNPITYSPINVCGVNQPQAENGREKKPEMIDKLLAAVKNKRDVEDCVAVPRGIFKAYLLIMGGFALLGIAGVLPEKCKDFKTSLIILGNILNFLSAVYFAKPFAVKGVSPTINKDGLNS